MCMRIYTVLFFNFYFLCANKFLVYTVHFVFVHQWLSSYITGLKDLTLETDHESLLAFLKTGNLDEFKLIIQRFRTMLMKYTNRVKYSRGKNLTYSSRHSFQGISPDSLILVRLTHLLSHDGRNNRYHTRQAASQRGEIH